MKNVFLCSFLYITFQTSAQPINKDSLSNFSYLLTLQIDSLKISTTATGFIIKYNSNYYLTTSYHVLSGRNPFSDSLLYNLPSDFTSLLIWFKPKYGKSVIKKRYHLVDENHKRKFFTIPSSIGNIDLAILPLPKSSLPDNAKIYAIDEKYVDTTDKNIALNAKVIVVGFPGIRNDTNFSKPTIYSGNILTMKQSKLRHANIYFDFNTTGGVSGSPVYLYYKNSLKLAGINSLGSDTNSGLYKINNKIKGLAADIFYAMRIIKVLDKFKVADNQ